jgi:itaconyl-CoA hydratase
MEDGLYFEEYADDWSYQTGSKVISEEMVRTFVESFGYTSPTFADKDYASREYAGRMAPGLLGLTVAEGLVLNEGLTRRRGIFLMELTPKFLKPIHVGDSISNRVSFHSKRLTSKPDRGVVITDHDVVTDKGDVAIRYQSVRMIRTRQFVEGAGS